MKQSNFKLIGEFCLVSIFADNHNFLEIPAKIDSGADSSSLHINSAEINEAGDLVISLPSFYKRKTSPKELKRDYAHPDYAPTKITERIKKSKTSETIIIPKGKYRDITIVSSNGHGQKRYKTNLKISINGFEFETSFTLSNRNKNRYPILLGKHALKGRYLVDVSKSYINEAKENINQLISKKD